MEELNRYKNPVSEEEAMMAVRIALKIGECLMLNGGEVSRVEDTIDRICRAYGAARVDVFAITSVIFVTAIWKGGIVISQSRRVRGIEKNTWRLEQINSLSRKICSTGIDPAEARRMLDDIMHKGALTKKRFLIGSIIATVSFAAFFGGDWVDALVTCAVTFPIVFCQFLSAYLGGNRILANVMCCFVAGTAATLGCSWCGASLDMVMAGCIMVLIPGIAITSAVENMLLGDTLSGLLGFLEAMITALALAGGFALSQMAVGSVLAENVTVPIEPKWVFQLIQIVTSYLGSLGFSLLFGLRGRQLPVACIGAALTWAVYLLAEASGCGLFLSNVLATCFAGVYTEVAVRILKVPKTVLTFSVVVALIPGRALYNTMNYAIRSEYSSFAEYGVMTLTVAAAIAIGLTVVMVAAQIWNKLMHERKKKA